MWRLVNECCRIRCVLLVFFSTESRSRLTVTLWMLKHSVHIRFIQRASQPTSQLTWMGWIAIVRVRLCDKSAQRTFFPSRFALSFCATLSASPLWSSAVTMWMVWMEVLLFTYMRMRRDDTSVRLFCVFWWSMVQVQCSTCDEFRKFASRGFNIIRIMLSHLCVCSMLIRFSRRAITCHYASVISANITMNFTIQFCIASI